MNIAKSKPIRGCSLGGKIVINIIVRPQRPVLYIQRHLSCIICEVKHIYRTHVHMGSDHWVAFSLCHVFETL